MQRLIYRVCLPLCLFLTACGHTGGTGEYMTEDTLFTEDVQETVFEESEDEKEKAEQELIYVHVCGAVTDPGVYEFEKEVRVFAAVEAAGGFTSDADQNSVNLAQPLKDGQMLYIPTCEESMKEKKEAQEALLGLVNINTADEKALMELPGIGEARAKLIVQYRISHGGFQNPEELMQIEGIKESVYEKLKNLITIK